MLANCCCCWASVCVWLCRSHCLVAFQPKQSCGRALSYLCVFIFVSFFKTDNSSALNWWIEVFCSESERKSQANRFQCFFQALLIKTCWIFLWKLHDSLQWEILVGFASPRHSWTCGMLKCLYTSTAIDKTLSYDRSGLLFTLFSARSIFPGFMLPREKLIENFRLEVLYLEPDGWRASYRSRNKQKFD